MFLFDGAMGTMLQKYGLSTHECPDYYNISHPEVVQRIHREYAEAGSEFITTNTFGATPIKLADYGLEDKVGAIAAAAVQNARIAAPRAKIAGDIGPTGKFLKPLGTLSFDEAASDFYALAKALADAGADYIIIETIIDIQEMKAALTAAKAAAHLPVICQMTYTEDGRSITGTTPEEAVVLLDAMGADIIGANCSVGPDKLLEAGRIMASVTNKPIILQPNAGMPHLDGDVTTFPLSPEDMASYIPQFAEAGIAYTGGCCGTTPAHIRAIRKAIDRLGPAAPKKPVAPFTAFTSRTQIVRVGPGYAPIKIGERINPTGRKKMREELKEGNFLSVKKDALAQVEAGAEMLDVNMGVPGVDQGALMERAISELSMLCAVPFSIDSQDPDVIEKALKLYPGRPLINSVTAHGDLKDRVFPLAKKYGAAVLCLPLTKGDIPETAEERVAVLRGLVECAYSYGLRKEDILFDPLCMTAADAKYKPYETLRTLRLLREEFGCATVMGTSNVSFGLPDRPRLNAAFLHMALVSGMDAPIVNPLDEGVRKAFTDARFFLGFDPGAKHYIAEVARENEPQLTEEEKKNRPLIEQLKDAVIHGEKETAGALIEPLLSSGLSSGDIIKDGLTAAMSIVGDGFGAGKIYLPQVMLSAESMQAAFDQLKKVIPSMQDNLKGTFVICTVEGDIHDLGKNIVSALLENSRYKVIDLGKDVSIDAILKTVEETKADIVGLASLMTTTLPEMKKSVKILKEKHPEVKIMVGGAVVTPEYAASIGADSYAKDGIFAMKEADRLMGLAN